MLLGVLTRRPCAAGIISKAHDEATKEQKRTSRFADSILATTRWPGLTAFPSTMPSSFAVRKTADTGGLRPMSHRSANCSTINEEMKTDAAPPEYTSPTFHPHHSCAHERGRKCPRVLSHAHRQGRTLPHARLQSYTRRRCQQLLLARSRRALPVPARHQPQRQAREGSRLSSRSARTTC